MKQQVGALALVFLSIASCTTLPPIPVDRAEAFLTPSAGNLMILARHGTGFETALDRDYEEIGESSVLIRGDKNYDANKVESVRLNLARIH